MKISNCQKSRKRHCHHGSFGGMLLSGLSENETAVVKLMEIFTSLNCPGSSASAI